MMRSAESCSGESIRRFALGIAIALEGVGIVIGAAGGATLGDFFFDFRFLRFCVCVACCGVD